MKRIFALCLDAGILTKLLVSFLLLSAIPLLILGYCASENLRATGNLAATRAEEMGETNLRSAEEIGKTAIDDSVLSLDNKSTEAIELKTIDVAEAIARFLYERDKDIRILAALEPDAGKYLEAYRASVGNIIVPGPWPREEEAGNGNTWTPGCRNPENGRSWRHRPPFDFKKISLPLYREITFIDMDGVEQIKISDGRVSDDLKNVSDRRETYCRAEDYFSYLPQLERGEIYVSRVIGPYVKGWLHSAWKGVQVSEESAYAGKENPGGRRFKGIIRWATPVYDREGARIGYVTAALDHAHLLEFTNHVMPTEERFSDIPDAGAGNYAFLWDDRDRCICHPREFFICGYDPQTGKEVPGWVSEVTYAEYLKSGLPLDLFVAGLPPFRDFSQKKSGAQAQMAAGDISLDCRILDMAPQCQGWHDGTEDGGSGSFLIFWSGLWKLTTYAAVPYYTGNYGKSMRGFGYVTIGANVDEFHKAANITRADIEASIRKQGEDITLAAAENRRLIEKGASRNLGLMTAITAGSVLLVACVSVLVSLNITRPLRRLTAGAAAVAGGEFNQAIDVKSRDEIGQLARSFNEMAAAVAEVDRMKSEFVTIASHELRTPIHAMLLGVSGLLEGYSGAIDEEAREDLQLVKDGIERLVRLVENLLDLSRIEARKVELNLAWTTVSGIVDRAVDEISGLAAAHGHTIVRKLPPDSLQILADRDRIVQTAINLLSNSIKYTPDGGVIVIGSREEDGAVVIEVADNGCGIPSWAHEEVFKKFFQADKIMSRQVGGAGLGLTIAKGLVEKHGGTIRCESPLGEERFPEILLGGERKGTAFVIRLPKNGPKGA